MNRSLASWACPLALLLGLVAPGHSRQQSVSAATPSTRSPDLPGHSQWVAPTSRARAFADASTVVVTAVEARVRIQGRIARTDLQVSLANPGPRAAEAELLLPVPDGAAVSVFDFDGAGVTPSARLLPAGEARATYDAIVRRLRDPALLEFAGRAAVRSSVFPVAAGGTQAVRLTYEETLPMEGGRIDYELLRSAALTGTAPFSLTLTLVGDSVPATVYSPTHDLRADPGSRRLHRVSAAAAQPGTFRCSLLTGGEGLQASVIACPDAEGPGGTFLLFAGLGVEEGLPTVEREVTLVLDRSGSMAGEKFEQARTAALQVLEGLRPGEAFRIVDYSDRAESMGPAQVKSPESMQAARAYLERLTPGGGTNIEAALGVTLEPAPSPDRLPVVLFLTDGRPTVGLTREGDLRAMAKAANAHGRRVFPLGVGHDVNAPLLDSLALTSRATSTYVDPGEDIELAVGRVFRRLQGPLATDLALEMLDAEGRAHDEVTVRDLLPRTLPDLFEGEQLVLLGRYAEPRAVSFALSGRTAAGPRQVRLSMDFGRASPRNDFVPRLWASRRIAELSDSIRQAAGTVGDVQTLLADPRTKELAEESMRISVRFGVLSEFTSFLALEGTDLTSWNQLTTEARQNLGHQNFENRWGAQAVDTARNIVAQGRSSFTNNQNVMYQGNRLVPMLNVQQMSRGALVQRGAERIEGRLLEGLEGALPEPDQTVVVGSEAYLHLVDELVVDGRSDMAASEGTVLYSHRGQVIRQVQGPPTEAPEPDSKP